MPLNSDKFSFNLRSSKQPTFLFLVKGLAALENLGTLSFKILGVVEVSGTGLGIIVAGLLVVLVLPILRTRK